MKKTLFIVLVVILILVPTILLMLSRGTGLTFATPLQMIGTETPVHVEVTNPHGIRNFTAQIEQNGVRHTVYQTSAPASRFLFWRKHEVPHTVSFTAGTKAAPQVKDGKARLIVEVQSNDLRGRMDELTADVIVNTRPLTLSVDSLQHYINQGGSELVLFTVSGYWTEAGVRVGKYTFRSFPVPGKTSSDPGVSELFCLFAFPWDVDADTTPIVYARNPAGTEAKGSMVFKIFPKKFRTRDLVLDDGFLNKVVNQIDPGGSGDLLSRFLKINGEMRRENNKTLADLRLKTTERVLWSGPYVQLGNSKVESQFADVRTYIYQGKKVDQQVHLGFDLSVTQHTPVVASNDGVVAWAAALGIYGNCIVVDHGYGLQSIYGHLSEIAVKPGDAVKKGQMMGKSGATGLAGGDHLHYSMQVDGVQVNPVEWWDAHWIKDRIASKLPIP